MIRTIKEIVTGTTQYDGAGVKLVRVIGHPNVKSFDPFLMLDAFDSDNPEDYTKGFPWHPHRGIETVTYLISGEIEHGDSMGNKGRILDGCCQWMTAGSGIMHHEMPKPAKRMLGVQLWLNLPAKYKMTNPQYRDIKADKIPRVVDNGCTTGVVSGEYMGVTGAVQGDYIKTLFLDVDMNANSQFNLSIPENATLFVYIVSGVGWFGETDSDLQMNKRALLFNNGEEFLARSSDEGMRFFLFSADPIKEQVAWGGPIVMNTDKELDQAFKEIRNGTFIKERE